MKRLLVGGAILALGMVGVTSTYASNPDSNGAQRSDLVNVTPQSNHACDSSKSAQSVNSLNGFVILNAPGQPGAVKKIVGEVSLKNGVPGTYMVFLAQAGSSSGDDGTCQLTGTLTANDQGNGNSHIDTSKLDTPIDVPGAGGEYYVVLRNGPDEIYASAPVTVR